MRAEIIAVGSELLSGMRVNSNAQYLSLELRKIGVEVTMHSAVADKMGDIKKSLSDALGRNNIIILTGGLGPTQDDITKQAVCELLGLNLVTDESALEKIQSYFFRKGEKMAENNARQALIPEGSLIIKNELGLAPGSILKSGNQCIIMLPGVPSEMKNMFEATVKPFLKNMTGYNAVSKTVNVFGMSESLIAQSLSDLIENPSPMVATYADNGKVDIFVSAKSEDIKEAISDVDRAVEEIERRLGNAVYGVDEPSMHHAVVSELVSRKIKIATAESCTGGLIAQKITEISGASLCFEYGVSSYSEFAKNKMLGVLEETLSENGAVSAETACQMAVGVMNSAGSDMGVAVTGYAGPAASLGEPVGLVFIAVCNKETVWVRRFDLAVTGRETRNQIRELASLNAFDMVRRVINGIAIFNSQQLAVSEIANSPENREANSAKALFHSSKKPSSSSNDDHAPIMQGDNSFKARLIRFGYNLIPHKTDEKPEIVRKSVFLTAAVALFISVCYILSFFMGISQNQAMYRKLEKLKSEKPSASVEYPKDYLEEFGLLYQKNEDIAGWITLDGTDLNYPVVQCEDNDYYLTRNFYGKKERHGVPYVDYRNDIKDLDFNTILYGHNMKSDNQMFSELEKYYEGTEALTYYRKHPIISFDTVYEKLNWKIFAVFTANVDPSNGQVFEYYDMINPQGNAEFNEFIMQVKNRSIFNIPVDVKFTDKILTLSTCYYEYEGQRLVVMARLVRDGEGLEVDVNAATHNRGGEQITSKAPSRADRESSKVSTSSRFNSSRVNTSSRYNSSYEPPIDTSSVDSSYIHPIDPISSENSNDIEENETSSDISSTSSEPSSSSEEAESGSSSSKEETSSEGSSSEGSGQEQNGSSSSQAPSDTSENQTSQE